MECFSKEILSDHLIRIVDPAGVCCYLLVGTQRACLLDTCSGVGDIRKYAEALTNKPLFVILTHGHFDHTGGAGLFDEVYMSPEDVPVLAQNVDMKFRVAEGNRMFRGTRSICEADLVPSITIPTKPIMDGDAFDIGGVTIRMVSVPGHTPGMMCPLIEEDRTIIFGDACGVSVFLFDEFSSTVSEYRNSLCRLKQYEEQYDWVYRNHGDFCSPKELLDNVIECCDLILTGQDDHVSVPGFKQPLFMAKKVGPGMVREDGKQGNIIYSLDKAN